MLKNFNNSLNSLD